MSSRRDTGEHQARGRGLLVVGLGASAGGLEAFQRFLAHMPADSGMAFVVIQHLAPQHESLMPELLASHTAMPVHQVQAQVLVEPDHVYVIPPNATLTITSGVLHLSPLAEERGLRMPVDAFFRSLAQDQGERAVCIVLSGTGSDGALGVEEVKGHGGLALVQSPASAAHDGMPRSALATGLVDEALAPEDMPAWLLAYARGSHARSGELGALLAPICQLVQQQTGHDFSQYKLGTIQRRMEHRMDQLRVSSAAEYLERLRHEPAEIAALVRELLIGVTQFFRDPEAFEVLARQVIPRLLEDRAPQGPLRVWVAGCSTGEEAWSIAMLLRERMELLTAAPAVQIFATDIDAESLEVAREGYYPPDIAEQLTPRRLERFFTLEEGGYRVKEELRALCLFSVHDLLTDPPFSRLDLLCCRNVLIYLEGSVQERLIPLFHHALRAGGYLFLGAAEGLGRYEQLFTPVHRAWRIYQHREAEARPPLELPMGHFSRHGPAHPALQPVLAHNTEAGSARLLERALLQEYAPPGAVIKERGEVLYLCGRTASYLEPPRGGMPFNLFSMAKPFIREELRAAAFRAARSREPEVLRNLEAPAEGKVQRFNLVVRPLSELGADTRLLLVAFQELGPPQSLEPGAQAEPRAAQALSEGRLERELQATRERLRTTIEELESSNEQLRTSNEELQSANEELQTSKEELQSANEELRTVNAELQKKIEALNTANSDLQNLFESTNIAILFLDRGLRIKRFTLAAREVFRLIEADVGRPLTDIAQRITQADVARESREVLRTLLPRELPVRRLEGDEHYLMRLRPYRTMEGAVDGVVISFVAVTDLKRAQEGARQRAEELQKVMDVAPAAVWIAHDSQARSMTGSRLAYELLRAPHRANVSLTAPESERPEHFQVLHGGQLVAPEDLPVQRAARGEPVRDYEEEILFADGSSRQLYGSAEPLLDEQGRPRGAVAVFMDITERVRAERALHVSEERLRLAIEAARMGTWHWNLETDELVWTERCKLMFGLGADEDMSYERFSGLLHPEDQERVDQAVKHTLETGADYDIEYRALWPDGSVHWISAKGRCFFDEHGRPRRMEGVVLNIDAEKRAQEALHEADRRKNEFLAMLSHELRNPLTPIRNSLYILERAPAGSEQSRRSISVISRQVGHLSRIVDDLLDVTRIVRGKIQFQRTRVELRELVLRAVADHRAQYAHAGVELEVEAPPGELFMYGDATRLTQVIGNLLQNAVKFTDRGGHVLVSLGRQGERAVLRVRDDGVGIAPEVLGRLFQPFVQADTTLDRSAGGLGLGLAFVKGIVERHGGTVSACSAGRGQGAEFTLELPLESPVAAAPPPKAQPAPPARGRQRVLIIEDNHDAAETLREALEMEEHTVAVAYDGREGLRLARAFRPSVVLCDIGLPEMDGYEVCRALRVDEQLRGAYLVALTGYASPEDRRRALEAGFAAHLAKPPDLDTLERMLAELPGEAPHRESVLYSESALRLQERLYPHLLPIALYCHRAVYVRPPALGAQGPVALRHLLMGKTKAVLSPHAEDDVPGPHPLEEGLRGGGARAVVRRLEHGDWRQPASLHQRLLGGLLYVPREQHRHLPVPHPQHDALVIHPLQQLPVHRRPEHLQLGLSQPEGRVAHLYLLHPRPRRRLHDLSGERSTRGARRQPQRLRGHLPQRRGQPERMIRVRVAQHRQVQPLHPHLPQVGHHIPLSGVGPLGHAAPVHQRMVPARAEHHRVPLAHREEGHSQPWLWHQQRQPQRHRQPRGHQQPSPPPAPLSQRPQPQPCHVERCRQPSKGGQLHRGHRQARKQPRQPQQQLRGPGPTPQQRRGQHRPHHVRRRPSRRQPREQPAQGHADDVGHQPRQARPTKGVGHQWHAGPRHRNARAQRLQHHLPGAPQPPVQPALLLWIGRPCRQGLAQRRGEQQQAQHREERELQGEVRHARGRPRHQHQRRCRQRVERIRPPPQRQPQQHHRGHDRRAHRRWLVACKHHVRPDKGHRGRSRQAPRLQVPPALGGTHQQPAQHRQQHQRQRRHVQPAHAQHMRQPAAREGLLQRVIQRRALPCRQGEEERRRVLRGRYCPHRLRQPLLRARHVPLPRGLLGAHPQPARGHAPAEGHRPPPPQRGHVLLPRVGGWLQRLEPRLQPHPLPRPQLLRRCVQPRTEARWLAPRTRHRHQQPRAISIRLHPLQLPLQQRRAPSTQPRGNEDLPLQPPQPCPQQPQREQQCQVRPGQAREPQRECCQGYRRGKQE